MTVRTVRPARVHGRIRAPPSKSYTHRALVAAFLAERPTEVIGPLDSDDTRATRDGLRALGAQIRHSRAGWRVSPLKRRRRTPRAIVRCGESGTTLRFLSAVAALGSAPVNFTGAPQLARRPMRELYGVLRTLGASVRHPSAAHALPCTIQGPLSPGKVSIRGDVSSQFISALLMVLPTLPGPSRLRILGATVSQPYVEATCAVLDERGVRVRRTSGGFSIPGNQRYRTGRIRVPGDASSAAYLWAAAAATGGHVEVEGVPSDLPQADLAILPILSGMGARVRRTSRFVSVAGPLSRPVSIDLTDSPDLVPLVSVLAALVPGGRSQLSGAPHLEFKESNRRVESVRLARAMGAKVSQFSSCIEIIGTDSPRSLKLPSLQDHRLVMSATVAGLAARRNSRVGRAEAVSKSYPGFWDALGALTQGGGTVR
ncbi:MAG: 3-phosphoshikimate 1-carboxyvinyltransferase [Thermoplasmata archaeon]